jgi:hypothetical protein
VIFLHGIIDAIFSGHTLKCFDVTVGDLNIAYALILPDKLFDRLLAIGFTGPDTRFSRFFSLR